MKNSGQRFLGPTEATRNFSDSLKMLRTEERPLLDLNQAFSLAAMALIIFIIGILAQV